MTKPINFKPLPTSDVGKGLNKVFGKDKMIVYMAKDEEKKGNPMADLKWFIIIIVAFWFISKSGIGLFGGTNVKKPDTSSSQKSSSQVLTQSSKSSETENKNSKWKGVVTIGRGNASGEQYPRYEYITLKNTGKDERINITGWSLTNGKDKKYFPVNDKQVKGVSNKVFIPKGTLIFIPNSVNHSQEDIVLAPNNEAIITTGNPYGVKTSFRENICNGYIQESEDYNFRPSLNNNCPDPENEEGVKDLDDTCYKFVRQMSSCHEPEFKDVVYKNKVALTGYVDDVGNLTYSCKEFIKKNYNYNSCILNHLLDKDFFEKKWRIFLYQPFELWAKDRETITLYDKEGKMVDELVYGY